MAVAIAAAMVVAAMVVVVVITAAMVVATVAVAIAAAMVVATPNLTKLLVQKVGKIEVMETLQKTLNMKVGEVGEKEEFPMRIKYQTRRTNNPFL